MKSHIVFTNVKLSLTNFHRSFITRIANTMFIWILPVASPLSRFTLKRYFLFPLPFAKSGRETGLTKWLCAPGNRPTETPERIWALRMYHLPHSQLMLMAKMRRTWSKSWLLRIHWHHWNLQRPFSRVEQCNIHCDQAWQWYSTSDVHSRL